MSLVKVDYGDVGGGKVDFKEETIGQTLSYDLTCDFKPKKFLLSFNFGSQGFSFYYDEDYDPTKVKYTSGSSWAELTIGATSGLSFNILNVTSSAITIMLNASGTYYVKYMYMG